MISAEKTYGNTRRTQTASRRKDRGSVDPLEKRAKMLADLVWERAQKVANALAPGHPADQDEINDHDAWLLLEAVAVALPPAHWDDPSALEDLYRLRKMFMPDMPGLDQLKIHAQRVKKVQRDLPSPDVTPENPLFEKKTARLARGA